MHISHLALRQFRNIRALDWEPAPGLNLIWGDNGQGKTNLLEAAHMALTGRSFRTRRDEECLPWDRPDDPNAPTLTEVALVRRTGGRRLRLLLGRGWKRAFADNQWVGRLADLWTEAAVTTFTPDESTLFKSPPAVRRRLLDMTLSHLARAYLLDLQRYMQSMRQLNALLKRPGPDQAIHAPAQAYFPILAESGAALMLARARRLADAASPMADRFKALGGQNELHLTYDPDLKRLPLDPADPAAKTGDLAQAYLDRLEAAFPESRRLGQCSVGVHRDDFSATLDGQDLRKFGSQGQHRLVALTLKLEAARWIQDAAGDPPILLLDDFGSELDPARRAAVLRGLKGAMQVFVTATHPSDLGSTELFDQCHRIVAGELRAE